MSENNRFEMFGSTLYEYKNGSKVELTPFDCFCLLIELSDENEGLKSTNMEMEDYLARLEEENEQLKQEIVGLNKYI